MALRSHRLSLGIALSLVFFSPLLAAQVTEPPAEPIAEVTAPVRQDREQAVLAEGVLVESDTFIDLELTISETGTVSEVIAAPGQREELVTSALAAAHRFTFTPALSHGKPIPVVVTYRYLFAANVPVAAKPAATPPSPSPPAAPSERPAPADDPTPPNPRAANAVRAPAAPALEVFEGVAEVEAPPREPTKVVLPKEQLSRIPGARGDAIRAIEVLPGVARAPAGYNPIIRGSSGEDSLTLLDGAAIPNLYHFGGITSIVHPALLEEVDLYPGNFSARYGRAMGGVIEAKLRDPRTDAIHGMLDINLIDSSLMLEAPITQRVSFAGAARRSNIDFVFENFVPEGTFNVVAAPVYWDYQAISHIALSSTSSLRLSAYGARDSLKLVFDNPSQFNPKLRGSIEGGIEFHHVQLAWEKRDAKLRQSAQVTVGTQNLRQKVGTETQAHLQIFDWAARGEWDLTLTDSFHWINGIDVTGMRLSGGYRGPAASTNDGSPADDNGRSEITVNQLTTHQLNPAVYSEARLFPAAGWLVVPGVRFDYYEKLGSLTVNPRLSQRLNVAEHTTFKSGIGVYSQQSIYYEQLPVVGNPKIDPQHALHASLGVEQQLVTGLDFSGEVFYKHLWHRIVGTEGGAPPSFINHGRGRIYGLEASLRFAPDVTWFGQLSYTLSRSERQDRDDAWRLFDVDQTHVLNVVLNKDLGAGWEVGGRFRLVSGNPTTPITSAAYDAGSDSYVPFFGNTNSERDSAFQQLDVRVAKRFLLGPVSLQTYLEIQNVYNAENQEGYTYSYDYSKRESATSTPFFPNLGLRGEL